MGLVRFEKSAPMSDELNKCIRGYPAASSDWEIFTPELQHLDPTNQTNHLIRRAKKRWKTAALFVGHAVSQESRPIYS